MERPQRPQVPELERHQYIDNNGVVVSRLTPESEAAWARYLTATRLCRAAEALEQLERQPAEAIG